MSDVFLSYKSEDANRISRLAAALQQCGFDVWWDRYLPGGENWGTHIRSALENARCVIVAWTEASVGREGDFVRDEAREGKRRGILVPIRLDRVEPPLGFGEIQAIDLTRWNGSDRDAFFQDLVAAIRAKIEGRPVPAAKGPILRLKRRLTYGTLFSLAAAGVGAFGSNAFHIQEKACAAPQAVSDLCGALGFGNRPTKVERLAWQALRPGNCDDLRNYVGRFPDGAYRGRVQSLLVDRQVKETAMWTPGTRQLALGEGLAEKALPSLEAAKTDALDRAQGKAENLCKGFAATTMYKFKGAKPQAQKWECAKVGTGFSCGFDGQAICEVEEKSTKVEETCGK
jgi:hypothetical protein